MNLNNFEEYIDDVIIQRGKNYFKNGHVDKIEEKTANQYVVEVAGSDYYTVEVTLDDHKNIMVTSCDCPYDFGEFCKHQAAAFFALRKLNTGNSEKTKQSEKPMIDLPTILSNFSKEKLERIIIDLSREYPDLEKRLLFQYAPNKNEIAASKKLIKDYIKSATHRGFIEWNRVSDALKGVFITLDKARDKIETGDSENAVSLCLVVLSSVVDMLGYCDDSGGEVSMVVDESFDIINEAILRNADLLDEQQQMKLYEMIVKEALNQRYEGWTDWKLNFFQACVYLAFHSAIRQKLEKELDRMIECSGKEDSWSTGYMIEQVKLLQLDLLERFDGEDKAFQFIRENIRFNAFREKAIIRQLQKENYQEVVRLCLEGEETDQNYRGLIHKWKQYRLQGYEGLGDIASQREMLLDFVLGDHAEYYGKLKKLYSTQEWPEVVQSILQTFEDRSSFPGTYVEILKKEKLTEKLLAYCGRYPYYIEDLYSYLIEQFEDEVKAIFVTYIESDAALASDRKKYKKVCTIIKNYQKACGKSNALQVMNLLKEKYKRRPAFVDELEKLERKFK